MQWIEVSIHTTSKAIELVADRLTVLGFDSFIIDDEADFHHFLETNRQYKQACELMKGFPGVIK